MALALGTELPSTTSSVLDAGAAYIDQGFRVVIDHGIRDDGSCTCGSSTCKPGKHPVIGAWQKKVYATRDEWRDALSSKRIPTPTNLGIVLGKQLDDRYLLAIDADVAARLAELEAVLGELPVTLTARSGGGGSHRIYALAHGQDPKRMRNRGGLRLETESPTPGVDVKVSGGQVVVCPSLHVSGERYSWLVVAPVAALPQRWFDVIAEAIAQPTSRPAPNVIPFGDRYLASVIENNCRDLAGRGKGERNSVLFSKACTVLEHCAGAGASFTRALPHLRDAGIACGLPRAEVDEVLRKAERHVRSSGKTRSAPPMAARQAPADATTGELPHEPEPEPDNEWAQDLARSQSGTVKATLGNACLVLRKDPIFKGRLTYNRMRITPCVDGVPLTDADLVSFRESMELRWGFAPGVETMASAVLLVSNERAFHPLQDYLGGLVWDGVERIDRVAHDVLGVAEPDALTRRMLRCWFISAVARAMRPGCKVDTTIVLTGEQGYRKSTFFATLGGEWFSDTYVDIRNKDGILQVHAAWLLEWAEIERVTIKASSSDVKAFLTSASDSIRPPFGRGVLIQPRSSVIVGTTNKAFLDDETGSRRFWPIPVCQVVNIAQLAEWRDQLWAEAMSLFVAGESWWLTAAEDLEREHAADEHIVENPWLRKVAAWLEDPRRREEGVTVADVMTGAMGLDLGRAQRGDETRAGKALSRLKWWWHWETRNGVRLRTYYPSKYAAPGST